MFQGFLMKQFCLHFHRIGTCSLLKPAVTAQPGTPQPPTAGPNLPDVVRLKGTGDEIGLTGRRSPKLQPHTWSSLCPSPEPGGR